MAWHGRKQLLVREDWQRESRRGGGIADPVDATHGFGEASRDRRSQENDTAPLRFVSHQRPSGIPHMNSYVLFSLFKE